MRIPICLLLSICLLYSCGNSRETAHQTLHDAISYTDSKQQSVTKPAAKLTDSISGCWKLVYIFFGNDRYRDMLPRRNEPNEWALIENNFISINDKHKLLVNDTMVKEGDLEYFHSYRLKSHAEIYVHFTRNYDSLYYGKKGAGDEEWSFTFKRCDTIRCKRKK